MELPVFVEEHENESILSQLALLLEDLLTKKLLFIDRKQKAGESSTLDVQTALCLNACADEVTKGLKLLRETSALLSASIK